MGTEQRAVVVLAAVAVVAHEVLGWAGGMALAMMLPTALPAVGYVAANSLRRRRRRAVALFVVAFAAPWAALALVRGPAVLAAVTVAVEVLWGAALHAKARRPYPLPLHDSVAPLRFGLRQAGYGLVACGPLMAAMSALPHIVVAAATVYIWRRSLPGGHVHRARVRARPA